MELKPGNFCPLLKKDCIGLQCKWFRPVECIKPGTQEHYQEWDCAMGWLVVLGKDSIAAALTTTASADKTATEIRNMKDGITERMDATRIVELPAPQPLALGNN